MNKKFSTLVAGLLLATSVGISAADYVPGVTLPKKYEAGKAYLLRVGSTGDEYVSVAIGANGPVLETKALGDAATLSGLQQALWEVKVTPAEAGTLSPKYVLTNRYTGTVLAINKSKALEDLSKADGTNNAMGGDLIEWLVEIPSEKPVFEADGTTPTANTLYVSYGKDNKVIALSAKDLYGDAGKEVFGKIIGADQLEADDDAINFIPYYATGGVTLSANDLNTQFGVNGKLQNGLITATKDNFFKLNINPAVSEGEDNFFASELQARAVDRWEIEYGEENTVIETGDYLSMYPMGTVQDKDKSQDDISKAISNTTENTFALYSKVEGKYIVVDTAYVAGTDQETNKRIKFGVDGLYNAKDASKYRLPASYLFQFKYDPTSNVVTVVSQGYATKVGAAANKQVKTTTVDADFYRDGYKDAPVKQGSRWANADYTAFDGSSVTAANELAATLNSKTVLTYARLGNTVVHTLGATAEADFSVKVGTRSDYQLTNLGAGVYLFKVVGIADPTQKDRLGKYWVKNLAGASEYAEQAKRQDYQEMPAAQWVVESAGASTSYAPIKINNREFNGAFTDVTSTGLVYTAGENRIFFFGGDTLEYTKVAKANVAELGYKYATAEEMEEAVYTFNYLHDLAMDKPINTKTEKDSVVWVDKDGNDMKFQLSKVLEDTYGYNAKISGVAQLKRLVYNVRVKDATKLQNDGRYLAYNADLKKYYVTTETAKAGKFFLKENNNVEGDGYYTILNASLLNDLANADNAYLPAKITEAGGEYAAELLSNAIDAKENKVMDADVNNYVYTEKLPKTDPNAATDVNGIKIDSWKVKEFDTAADAKKYGTAYTIAGSKFIALLPVKNENYATSKVSVDNNTLDLVNGELSNGSHAEVANSAFAVKKDDSKLYRTIGDVEGEVKAGDNVLNFFRVNSTSKEYLYEDANSVYSKGLGMNFLGVEGKGDSKNSPMLVKYVTGTKMPQYLIAVDTTVYTGYEYICPECGLATCEHSKVEKSYIDGRFLINLNDSVVYHNDNKEIQNKYQWGKLYTRLAFVDARLMGDKMDSLVVKNSVYTGNTAQMNGLKDSTTWASLDTIKLTNKHNPALFSFRLIDDTNNFMIESESWKDGKAFSGAIAPKENGGWVKIQNGVPVIIKTSIDNAFRQAEIFNVETTDKAATSNEGINATEVSIVAGNGNVTIKNAEGKKVAISNILGQSIANTVISSDNATITVPAGIVVVSVEGEDAVKAIVK